MTTLVKIIGVLMKVASNPTFHKYGEEKVLRIRWTLYNTETFSDRLISEFEKTSKLSMF